MKHLDAGHYRAQRFSIFVGIWVGQALTACLLSLSIIGLLPGLALAKGQDTDGKAYVRVIHASPFVGTADVFVDGKPLLSSFEFGAVTDYVAVPQGVHHVQIALVGKGIDASVITQDLTVQAGTTYTVAALGTSPDHLSLQGFVDDNQVAANQARVRVYHLAPDTSDVKVQIGDESTLNDVAYPQASDYVTVDTGSCTFTVSNLQGAVTKQLTTTLKPDTITSLFTIGLVDGNPRLQLVSAQAAGVPTLPQTGSDPTPQTSVMSFQPLWLLLGGAFMACCGGLFFILSLRKRQSLR